MVVKIRTDGNDQHICNLSVELRANLYSYSHPNHHCCRSQEKWDVPRLDTSIPDSLQYLRLHWYLLGTFKKWSDRGVWSRNLNHHRLQWLLPSYVSLVFWSIVPQDKLDPSKAIRWSHCRLDGRWNEMPTQSYRHVEQVCGEPYSWKATRLHWRHCKEIKGFNSQDWFLVDFFHYSDSSLQCLWLFLVRKELWSHW